MDLEQRLARGPLRVRDVWSAEMTARLASRVVRLRRRRSLARAALGAGAVASAALALALGVRPAEQPVAAATASEAAQPGARATGARERVVLHDGSRAELQTPDSRLHVIRDGPEGVKVRLQRGRARFAVVHNPRRRFEVEAGEVRVRVKGTTFTVAHEGASTRVEVERGRVQVLWAGTAYELTDGQAGTYPPPEPQARAQARPSARPEQGPKRAPTWRELAERGDYAGAYAALQAARVAHTPEDHMLAADVARLSGHPSRAVPHLRAVARRFPDDPRAPVAAFTLGRVLLHDLKRPRDAARAFAQARRLWPRGPLALDAWASEAEALREAGEPERAAEVAAEYLKRHPSGRHARALRPLLASN